MFRPSGNAMDCVHTGEEANEALYSEEYALVILDLGLPDIDGIDVLRRIRRRRVRVLILDARDSLRERVEGLDLGRTITSASPSSLRNLKHGHGRSSGGDAAARIPGWRTGRWRWTPSVGSPSSTTICWNCRKGSFPCSRCSWFIAGWYDRRQDPLCSPFLWR